LVKLCYLLTLFASQKIVLREFFLGCSSFFAQ
jgi:hypothetical protein